MAVSYGRGCNLADRDPQGIKEAVVVLVDGRSVVMNRWADKVAAVVMAFSNGEECGTEIA